MVLVLLLLQMVPVIVAEVLRLTGGRGVIVPVVVVASLLVRGEWTLHSTAMTVFAMVSLFTLSS